MGRSGSSSAESSTSAPGGAGLTQVPGILVGHYTDPVAATGCTAILSPQGAVAGVDVRGGAPGTRELALLDPTCTVERVHGVMLSGGSAFGLAAADGAMRWLAAQGYGFDVGIAKVPIVPAAILFDLSVGRSDVYPDAEAGYAACAAASDGPVAEGSVGAGTGATVGKLRDMAFATKAGVGMAAVQWHAGPSQPSPYIIGALAVANAWGDVLDPASGRTIAGTRGDDGRSFYGALNFVADLGSALDAGDPQTPPNASQSNTSSLTNTTLVVVATNAPVTKAGAAKVAQMAHAGLARAIRPVHTPRDGDLVFALSTAAPRADPAQVDLSVLGTLAAEVTAQAIVRAVMQATGLHGIPAASELNRL